MASPNNKPRPAAEGTAAARGEPASIISGYAIAIAKALDYSGVDSPRVFRAAGVDAVLCNDPLQRLPVTTIARIYKVCVDATGDPCFGLTVAKFMHASNLHALGYGLLASSTLMDFCLRLQRYMRLVSRSAQIQIEEAGPEVRLISIPEGRAGTENEDAWLAFLMRTMRLLHRTDFRPLRVEFMHARPAGGDAAYVSHFGAPVAFDRPAAVLALPAAEMTQPLPGACPELAQFNDSLATRYLAKLDRSDVVACVRARIIETLPSGECTREQVAGALATSPATLQSKLARRGTTFHALLDDLRHELARNYLRQPALSITEIGCMLGFTDLSNFSRAFKRWTGTSPSEFRSRARDAPAPGSSSRATTRARG